MANVDRPQGFIPVKHLNGSPWNGQTTHYLCSDTNALYIGDLAKLDGGSGAAGTHVNGISVEGMPSITRVTAATDTPVGVVVGFLPLESDLSVKYKKADSTDRIALVVDDPTVLFEIQEDALGTPIAAASIGLNANFTTTSGSTSTGVSGMEIDSSSVATTATLPLQIVALVNRADNAFNTAGAGTDNAKFLVRLNEHQFVNNQAGV